MKTYASVFLIASWMLVGGVAHMWRLELFFPIVPGFFPKLFIVYASGIVELVIGIAVILPKTRTVAGLAFAILCLCFLPLHLWDLIRDDPAKRRDYTRLRPVFSDVGGMATMETTANF